MQKALFRSAKEPVLQIGNREQKIRKLQPHFGNSKVWATKTEDILRRKIPIFFKEKERETENNCSDGVGEPQTKYGKNEMGE